MTTENFIELLKQITLFRYFLLQVLRIVDAGFCVIVLFVNAKNENSAIILVGTFTGTEYL